MGRFFPFFGHSSATSLEYYAVLYMLLVTVQMMLDAALFQTVIDIPPDSEEPLNLYQCILIPVHFLQSMLQFLFGFDFHKAIIKKSFRRIKNWKVIYLCLVAVEASVFVAFIALASFSSIFTYVTAFAILSKAYLIWPLKLFLEECQDVCVPLAHAAAASQQLNGLMSSSSGAGPSSSGTGTSASCSHP